MVTYYARGSLRVAAELCSFIEEDVMPGTGIEATAFWAAYENVLQDLGPENQRLLDRRNELQSLIDRWHDDRTGQQINPGEYRAFLRTIGYLVPPGEDFEIEPTAVDSEISRLSGPQLVVPLSNARFALNAANARWVSLYDAFYSSDAIDKSGALEPTLQGNPLRRQAVVAETACWLDRIIPLAGGLHAFVELYEERNGSFFATVEGRLLALADPSSYLGSRVEGEATSFLFVHNNLRLELVINHKGFVGQSSPSGLDDVILEAAVTTIQDCEDSVAAVDAADKVGVYRNWLGLMKGTLVESVTKGSRTVERRLAVDKVFIGRDGEKFTVPGRSLMLVRHVGHHMLTDAVLNSDGRETPEAFLDAFVTLLAAKHDLARVGGSRNGQIGSIYVVKPKMHGPEEAAFANTLLNRVEDALGLARYTVKIGVMDEERRTTVNLKEVIRAVRKRIVFINTGFLDRTADEIHTSMRAGPVLPKDDMKASKWLLGYERNNVDIGLKLGFAGRAQIGKGMWAKPDALAEMLLVKSGQVRAGASTAWVPSPTAAALHALHYHEGSVSQWQAEQRKGEPVDLDEILTPPLLNGRNLSPEQVRREVDNNCQSILGYVVRWIDQGVGCSKVPDINDVPLMEDRATLRISSQHLANWLFHGVVDRAAIEDSLRRMALAVDRQNANDPSYMPMSFDLQNNIAYQTASSLIFDGINQSGGYTEPLLHDGRRRKKASADTEAKPVNISVEHS